MSDANNVNFDTISDFISKLRFSIKKSTLANTDRKEVQDAKKAKEIIDSTTFVELPDPFEQEIVDNLFKDLEHKKKNIPLLNRRLKMFKLLKQKHRSQTVNFQNLNRKLVRLTTQQQNKNHRLTLLI